jgi:hypothetical protein
VADVTPLEDEVGDEARAERLAASAIGRFVRYLELMRARDGETSEVLDIRVEVESAAAADHETDGETADAADGDPDEIEFDGVDVGAIDGAEGHDEPPGALEIETVTPPTEAERRRDLVIPDDPTVLSYLLSGIVQIELPRRQALLEAVTTAERLESLVRLLDRELLLLANRLRLFSPDPRLLRGPRRS